MPYTAIIMGYWPALKTKGDQLYSTRPEGDWNLYKLSGSGGVGI